MIRLFFISAIAALGLLSACGNKGPLYLPDTEIPSVSMTPTTPPATVTTQDETKQ